MNFLMMMIILALIATIGSLLIGVVSMGRGGGFDEKHSHQLMFARVGFQGIAVLLLFIALFVGST